MVAVVGKKEETSESLQRENGTLREELRVKAALERQLGALRTRADQLERDKSRLQGENEDLRRDLERVRDDRETQLTRAQFEERAKAKQDYQEAEAKWKRDITEIRE